VLAAEDPGQEVQHGFLWMRVRARTAFTRGSGGDSQPPGAEYGETPGAAGRRGFDTRMLPSKLL
jgi:hypothetical protein